MLVWQPELSAIVQDGNFEDLNINTRLKACSDDLFWRVQFYTHLAEIGLFECLKRGLFNIQIDKTARPRSGPLQIGSLKKQLTDLNL